MLYEINQFIGLLSVITGTLGVLNQKNLKILLGLSSVSQIGFLLFCLNSNNKISYGLNIVFIALYILTNLGFIVIVFFKKKDNLIELTGIFLFSKLESLIIIIFLFS